MKHDYLTIKGYAQSAFAELLNPDGRVRIEQATSLTSPYAVRGSIYTAHALLTRGTETTLFSGVAGKKLDLIFFSAINSSSASNLITFRVGTGGNKVYRILIPAYDTMSVNLPVPLPQDEAGAAITAQTEDWGEISDSAVTISALAVEN
ncbi:MAG: hypothetical protein AAB706_02160 [Patescibacteria group bacterium]